MLAFRIQDNYGKRTHSTMYHEHVGRYAQIYAAASSGEPWNDPWTVEDAEVQSEFQSLED